MQRAKTFLVLPKTKDNSKKGIMAILKKAKLKVQRVETELIGDAPIIWVTATEEKKMHATLHKAGVKSFPSDMTTVKLPEKPGEIAKIARILMSSGIEVRDAHLIIKSHHMALYGVTTDKPAETRRLVDKIVTFMEKEGKE